MKGNIAGLMQQAQKMQQEMQKAQEELANMVVTGEAAGGLVKVTMTGKHAVTKVEIDPSLLDDQEMLEDIVTAAINDAVNRIASTTQDRMSDMTAGINLPPGMKLPF
jgi:DNA-binding YbaB/EbfC family protein